MHRTHYVDSNLTKNRFAKQVSDKYGLPGIPNVQPQILRAIKPLTNSESYTFDFRRTASNGAQKWLERLMNDQRYYAVREARLLIFQTDSAATESTPAAAPQFRTFVDTAVFANAAEQTSLRKVYEGDLSFLLENDIIVEDFPTNLFLDDMAGSQVGTLTEDKGFITFEPNFVFKGDEKMTMKLDLGWGTNANIGGAAAATTNYVAIELLVWEHLGQAAKATSGACPIINYNS